MLRINLKGFVPKTCALWIVIWAISPPLQYGTIFRVLSIVAAIIWLFVVGHKAFFNKNKEGVLLLILLVSIYAVFSIFIKTLSGMVIVEAITSNLQMLIFCLTMCMSSYYINSDRAYLKTLAMIAVIFFCIWSIFTLHEYIVTPGISRVLSHATDVSESYARKGVGGYGLVYPIVFVFMAMLLFLLSCKKFKKRILGIVAVFISAMLVLESGYFIANVLLITVFVAILSKLHDSENIISTALILIFIITVVLGIMLLIIANENTILSFLGGNYGSFYVTKMQNIIDFLKYGEIEGKLLGRTSRYIETLVAVVKHPLCGAYIAGEPNIVGGHSTVLDVFAQYGLAFSWPWYLALYCEFKILFRRIRPFGNVFLLLMIFILNGLFNTYVATTGVAVFIIVPGVLIMLERKGEENMHENCSN